MLIFDSLGYWKDTKKNFYKKKVLMTGKKYQINRWSGEELFKWRKKIILKFLS